MGWSLTPVCSQSAAQSLLVKTTTTTRRPPSESKPAAEQAPKVLPDCRRQCGGGRVMCAAILAWNAGTLLAAQELRRAAVHGQASGLAPTFRGAGHEGGCPRRTTRLPADARPGCCVVRLDSWFASARSWVQFPEHPLPGETLSSRTAMAGEGELLGAGLACQRQMMAARPGSACSAQHVCTGASTRGSWSGALAKRPAPPTATSPGRTLCMGWSRRPVCTQSAAQSLLV